MKIIKLQIFIKRLTIILENIQNTLQTSPEQAALVSLDTVMVGIMSIMGIVGKVRDSSNNERICQVTRLAIRTLEDYQHLMLFEIQGINNGV